MENFYFETVATDKNSGARAGILHTPHGDIKTPVYMPVGTQATVKGVYPRDLDEAGAQIILANTYHLYMRPGDKIVKEAFAIVSMTESQKDFLTDMRWNAFKKAGEEAQENNVHSFYEITGYEVIDPYGKDIDCYRYVYGLLCAGIDRLIDKLDLRLHAYVPKTKKPTGAPKKRGRPRKNPVITE